MSEVVAWQRCIGCHVVFPATRQYFYRDGDGLKAKCKFCIQGDLHRRQVEGPGPAGTSDQRAARLTAVLRKHGLAE